MSPTVGAPIGQLELKILEKGNSPSFPISWLTRLCAKVTVKTFPRAEIATKTLEQLAMSGASLRLPRANSDARKSSLGGLTCERA